MSSENCSAFDECAGDGQGADIGTQWFLMFLTQLWVCSSEFSEARPNGRSQNKASNSWSFRPGAQHSEDAVRVEAVAVTRADVDGLRLEWLL
ncbi:hypothetical protein D0O09_31510 [Pseudomonas putida]|nr:hypothetical protein D0O09_31510 [Pseudomonas putida]